MKSEQQTIFEEIEQQEEVERPYFNGMGEPLPWESNASLTEYNLCENLGHSSESCVYGGFKDQI